MMLINNFNNSINEVNDFFSILSFIDKIETYKGKELSDGFGSCIKVTTIQQQYLRSSVLVILYNIVEATLSEMVLSICDAINDDKLKYNDLIDELQMIWIGMQKYSEKCDVKNLIVNSQQELDFSNYLGKFSGNVDLRKIIEVSNSFKLKLGVIPNKEDVGCYLLYIKNARNKLAHGDYSYSRFGSLLLLNDLQKMKDVIIAFFTFYISKVDDYIKNKQYRR